MTVRDYLAILKDRLLVALIVVALTTLSALVFSIKRGPQYVATGRLLVEPVAAGSDVGQQLQRVLQFQTDVLTEGELLRSALVADRVKQRLQLTASLEDLIESVIVLPVSRTSVLAVSARADSIKLAQDLSNAFMEEYITVRREQAASEVQLAVDRLVERTAGVQAQLDELDKQLRSTKQGTSRFDLIKRQRDQLVGLSAVLEGQRQMLLDSSPITEGRGVGRIIQQASISDANTTGGHLRTMLLGFIVGIPLAIGLALLLDSMTDTVKTQEEAEKLSQTDALAVIPEDADWKEPEQAYLASSEAPHSPVAEAYRSLRINLEFAEPGVRKVLVTSPGAGDGKSATVANLAVAFSEAGRRVLVASGDLRRPRLHRFFEIEREPGISDLVRGDVKLPNALQEANPNLWIVPSGSPESRPDQLFSSSNLRSLMSELGRRLPSRVRSVRNGHAKGVRNGNGHAKGVRNGNGHAKGVRNGNGHGGVNRTVDDVLLLDAPGILAAAEAVSLVSEVEGVVLVMRVGVTRRVAVVRAADQIRRAGGKIVGCVLIGARSEAGYPSSGRQGDVQKIYATLSRAMASMRR